MELPLELKSLYRHWPLHVNRKPSISPSEIFTDKQLQSDISSFISERISIWKKKTSRELPPYTDDPILSQFRFCNIFREFDKQTIAFHKLLNPLRDDFPLWLLNMFYCRLVARPETILHTGLLSFDENENEVFYRKLMESPRPRYGTPYVFPVSVIQRSATPTREEFIAYYLPRIMHEISREIITWNKLSVFEGVRKILPLFKFNLEFLWTEVLIDVAYQFPDKIDLYGRFPIGPGSSPTMKRINASADPSILVQTLSSTNFDTKITYEGMPLILSAENWEGIGCEFRKYTNLSKGEGRRRLYTTTIQKAPD